MNDIQPCDLDNSNAELYRRMILSRDHEIEALRENVNQLQEQLQGAYKRIAELISEKSE